MWAFETKKSSEACTSSSRQFITNMAQHISYVNITTLFATSKFRYIKVPNDPSIPSGFIWWRENHKLYPDMGKLARDVLDVPASGCAVKRQFSISARITI
jgi:hAT family C-terminal dimerisation region